MAWNGSDNKVKVRGEGEQRKGSSSSVRPASARGPYRGLVAGLIVVALGCGAIWWFIRPAKDQLPTTNKPTTTRAIAEATPQIVTNKVAENEVQPALTPDERRLREIARLEAKYGTNMPPALRTHIYYLKHPPKVTMRGRTTYGYLRHPSERQIASFICAEPGQSFLNRTHFDERFDTDFVNALLDRIEVNDDDTDEMRAVKERVSLAKREIADMVKKDGRKPSEVMNELSSELHELGKYRSNIQQELDYARANGELSDDDVKDYYRAANKMLEKKGLKPVAIPSFIGRGKMLQRRQHQLKSSNQEK